MLSVDGNCQASQISCEVRAAPQRAAGCRHSRVGVLVPSDAALAQSLALDHRNGEVESCLLGQCAELRKPRTQGCVVACLRARITLRYIAWLLRRAQNAPLHCCRSSGAGAFPRRSAGTASQFCQPVADNPAATLQLATNCSALWLAGSSTTATATRPCCS